MERDPTTHANYFEIASQSVAFDWSLDFETSILTGSATHRLKVLKDGVSEVIFDTSDLEVQDAQVEGETVKHTLGAKHPVMGSALHIPLPSNLEAGQSISVGIRYKTTKDCVALQWLEKEQTQGRSFPFLFSQCQAIYARTMAPVQDTPSVKITYTARVKSVLPVLLSAIRINPPSGGPAHGGAAIGKEVVTYEYTQPVPIPTYLIAIASGNLRYKAFDVPTGKEWKSGVWAEPESIDAAFWEFSEDTAKFLAAEESVVTPYQFGVYDLLVLPPSFPYGGMENACLSFLTPSLLTGTRDLVDVVVHELTHSWFGNGITHAHATHFWLNEGWTTYIERVLQQVLKSPAARGFSYIIGRAALDHALQEYTPTPRYRRLVIDFEVGEDPEDAYSDIAYEKGANLLLHIERTLGGLDVFLPYVKEYANTFIGKSITTGEWKSHLYSYYAKHGGAEKVAALDSIDWDAWFYGQDLGLPVKMEYDTSMAQVPYDLAARWDISRSTADVEGLEFVKADVTDLLSTQIVVFLERLQEYPGLPHSHLLHLGNLYGISASQNSESISASHFAPEAARWVVGDDGTGVIKGRMKFCRPTLRAVFLVDKALATSTWTKHQTKFHPIARKMVDKDLELP
ncbi:unnamed protein product [Mycena citricolor]|uniref:Peptidase M1 leukotriene A4 hydrolase/aminopeptidase C-terminal domain-containing protein n=1 Tax=Mycena citricolor TaxID=2018698 RepID=A0AAD2H2L9_9AGAR|nr:unnamed protein product [Mycena citricolor]